METFIKSVGIIVIGFFVVLVASVIGGFFTMWLWNWLMPIIFGLIKLNIWQAIGLNFLCGLLFKTYPSFNKEK